METVSSLSLRRVKQRPVPERLLLPPFSSVMLADYPDETGSKIPHSHADFQMIAFLSGQICFEAGQTLSGEAGDVLLLPPNLRHSWSVRKSGRTVQILLSPVFCEEYRELRPLLVPDARMVRLPLSRIRHLWNRISREQQEPHPAANVMVSSILLEFLANALRSFSLANQNVTSGTSEGITRVLLYITRHYAEKIRLKDMASMACLSVSRFSALFHSQTGKSPMDFLIGVRLENAREMIFSTDRKISEIAGLCGFDSVSYFNRRFLAMYGHVPLFYRKT